MPPPRPRFWVPLPPGQHGFPYASMSFGVSEWRLRKGVGRLALIAVERITSACSTQVLCVSKSLHDVFRQWGLSRPDKLAVLAEVPIMVSMPRVYPARRRILCGSSP